MKAKEIRIVFMGTPLLAAWSLKELVEQGYHVVGVVTAADKPAGRGRKLTASPVKEYALSQDITVLQPENLKAPDFLEQLTALRPDLQVVVAFRMLPQQVWSLPPMGTFNMHASLLPQYRGAAPINWAIINGETETGVTTFMLDQQIDTGKILFRQAIPIEQSETAGSLHEKIKQQGSSLVIHTINALAEGMLHPLDQDTLITDQKELKKAPKIFKEDCIIDWNKPCWQVARHIHGLSPQPGAFTLIPVSEGETLSIKIFEVTCQKISHPYPPATMLSDHKTALGMTTPDGIIWVKSLQLPAKRRMNTQELLRGHTFTMALPWEAVF